MTRRIGAVQGSGAVFAVVALGCAHTPSAGLAAGDTAPDAAIRQADSSSAGTEGDPEVHSMIVRWVSVDAAGHLVAYELAKPGESTCIGRCGW